MNTKYLAVMVISATFANHTTAQHNHTEHGSGAKRDHGSGIKTTQAYDHSAEDRGPHGGKITTVDGMQLEAVLETGGLRVFAYNAEGQPLDVRSGRGVASLHIKGDAKRYRYDLFAEIRQDGAAESLAAAVDLSRIGGSEVELSFQLIGLTGASRKPIKWRTVVSVPMTKTQQVAAAIAEQKVCPISGLLLGKMGRPIPVTIGDQTVYVCCAGCIDALKANPSQYVIGKPTLTVKPATAADAAAIAAQEVCPVMDEPLGGMGTPIKVTGLPRDVYLCCKGCLKFLEKEPQKYLAKLPSLSGAAKKPVVVKATAADTPFAAAQKFCPVMDEPLDAMGGPYRTVVAGRVVYLCCPGCAKRLHADPQTYFDKLAQQGIKPQKVQ